MPGMSSRSEQASNPPVNTQKLSWHTWVQEKEQANNQTTPVESIRLTQVTNNKHSLRTPPNCLLGSPHAHTISVEGLSLWWLSSMHVVVVGVGGRVGWELRQGGAGGWGPTLLIQSTSTKIVEIKIILSRCSHRLLAFLCVLFRMCQSCHVLPVSYDREPYPYIPYHKFHMAIRERKQVLRASTTHGKQSDALPPPRTKHVNGQHLWYSTSCYWLCLGNRKTCIQHTHIQKERSRQGIDAQSQPHYPAIAASWTSSASGNSPAETWTCVAWSFVQKS